MFAIISSLRSCITAVCYLQLVPVVEGIFETDNFATVIKLGTLYAFHNHTFHVGRLYQVGTRVNTENCAVTGLEEVSEGDREKIVDHSRFSINRMNGTILVSRNNNSETTLLWTQWDRKMP